jgi:hypothetical protein
MKRPQQSKPKLQTMGEILLEHEVVIQKMVDHGLQWGDILALTHGYLMVHCPGAQEKYVKGGTPVQYYGPKEGLKDE